MVVVLVPDKSDLRPSVGVVTSVWVTVRKPRLATMRVAFEQVVALRIFLPNDAEGGIYKFGVSSEAMVLRPQAVLSILDIEGSQESTEGVVVTLTPESVALVQEASTANEWWPRFDLDGPDSAGATKSSGKRNHALLFVHRQGRKGGRKRKDAEAKKTSKRKFKKITKAVKKIKKSKTKKVKEIPFTVEKMRRTSVGQELIRQVMDRARQADLAAFPSQQLFNADTGKCALSIETCSGTSWQAFRQAAPMYFTHRLRTVCLYRVRGLGRVFLGDMLMGCFDS